MRAENVALAVAILLLGAPICYLWAVSRSNEYLRFVDRDPTYYSNFAAACDQIISEHPVGSNVVLWLSNSNVSPADVLLNSKDYSAVAWTGFPASDIIKKLKPDALLLRSNSVLVLAGFTKGARFGISWELETNVWVLSVAAGNGPQRLYSKSNGHLRD